MVESEEVEEKKMGFLERIKYHYAPQIKEFKYTLHLVRSSLLTMVGLAMIALSVTVAILAPVIAPYGPKDFDFGRRLSPPSEAFPLGTDMYGGDLYSRILYGLRLDLQLAVFTVTLAVVIGIIVGLVSAYFGGAVDEVLMRVTDVFLSFPGLILAMAVSMALQKPNEPKNIYILMFAIALVWWPSYARLIRGQILSEKEKLYVEAARALGFGNIRIMFKHLLPNVIGPLLVAITLDLGGVLLTAAGLSFIGFGAQPGEAELGMMISEGRNFITLAPWCVVYPGLAIFIVVLGFNLLGDGLRDVLDPRLRR
ncbi:MAG: ABC transporter permease [Candidatus Asgardarchaeia archaeon]